jgi:hypothetical protein
MDLRERGRCSLDWIHQAQDRDQWRAPVETIMNFRNILGNSRVVEGLVVSQEGLSFVKLVIYYHILFNMHDVVAAQNNSGHDFDIIVLGDTKYSGTQLSDITKTHIFFDGSRKLLQG